MHDTFLLLKILLIVLLNFSISYLLLERYFIDQISKIKRSGKISQLLLGIGNVTAMGIFGIPMYLALVSGESVLIFAVRALAIAVLSPLFAVFLLVQFIENGREERI